MDNLMTSRSSQFSFRSHFPRWFFTIPKLPRPRNDPPCGPCLDNPSGKFSEAPCGVRFGRFYAQLFKRCIKSTWKLDSGFQNQTKRLQNVRGSFMFPPKRKKNDSQVQKTPWCRCINQSAAHGFVCCSPSRWFFLKKKHPRRDMFDKGCYEKNTKSSPEMTPRFQGRQELFINSLSHLWWFGENIPRKVWCMATKKMGTPFNWRALCKGLLVCPVQRECLIFSPCWRRKPLYIGPSQPLTAYITVKTLK